MQTGVQRGCELFFKGFEKGIQRGCEHFLRGGAKKFHAFSPASEVRAPLINS